ncbi:PREDICTED: mitochondrial import inner membrane translocase subunit Tim21 [Cyprinodon variegatus]|uniref:Mitochondrial import inner membrane translocase subunit Tim21 n=1 Tax=Cyprinodon variegatus TaxID=28743 RepID=A0A3Q2DVZ9_CYPVA|nr:PREDICTED: mitochondrial import inner membrane translocase subunit Tim21 [Cyprinodon variegatus]
MMTYTHVLKVVYRNLRQTQLCFSLHALRTASTAPSWLGFRKNVPSLSCFTSAQRHQVLSFHCSARNRGEERGKSVSRYQSGTPKPSAAQKVKEAGRDFTYLIVVLVGLGVTGGLLYVVFQELFSSSSPNKVYSRAFNIVRSQPEVIGAFGEPIKCYGETTRRGRRQQVSHVEYMKDGLKHMRLKFYIEGSEPGLKGTVHTESKENPETGKYEFRYIFVDIDSYPRRTIIVEDNR